jgi:hypothetical protein
LSRLGSEAAVRHVALRDRAERNSEDPVGGLPRATWHEARSP